MKLDLLFEEQHRAAVAIVYDDHGNLLLGKAQNDDDRKGKWCFPGGKIKPGECPGDGAARECKEETGIEAKPQQMSFSYHKKPGVAFVVCRKTGGCLNPNCEFSELKWVPRDEVLKLELYSANYGILGLAEAGFP